MKYITGITLVERTLYLAQKMDPPVIKTDVKKVVKCYAKCHSIDPAPVIHKKGEIGIVKNWK